MAKEVYFKRKRKESNLGPLEDVQEVDYQCSYKIYKHYTSSPLTLSPESLSFKNRFIYTYTFHYYSFKWIPGKNSCFP